jgi:hypothetical protein
MVKYFQHFLKIVYWNLGVVRVFQKFHLKGNKMIIKKDNPNWLNPKELKLVKNNFKFKKFIECFEDDYAAHSYKISFKNKYKEVYDKDNDILYEEYGNAFIEELTEIYCDDMTSVSEICKKYNVHWKDLYINKERDRYEEYSSNVKIYNRYIYINLY